MLLISRQVVHMPSVETYYLIENISWENRFWRSFAFEYLVQEWGSGIRIIYSLGNDWLLFTVLEQALQPGLTLS
jgi:hypothetical protein